MRRECFGSDMAFNGSSNIYFNIFYRVSVRGFFLSCDELCIFYYFNGIDMDRGGELSFIYRLDKYTH